MDTAAAVMLRRLLLPAALLTLTWGHWSGDTGSGRLPGPSRYCRDSQGYFYHCDDDSWGSSTTWRRWYGEGGYSDLARDLGRGQVTAAPAGGVQLTCDFSQNSRFGAGQTVTDIVWRKVNTGFPGTPGGGSFYSDSRHDSGGFSNRASYVSIGSVDGGSGDRFDGGYSGGSSSNAFNGGFGGGYRGSSSSNAFNGGFGGGYRGGSYSGGSSSGGSFNGGSYNGGGYNGGSYNGGGYNGGSYNGGGNNGGSYNGVGYNGGGHTSFGGSYYGNGVGGSGGYYGGLDSNSMGSFSGGYPSSYVRDDYTGSSVNGGPSSGSGFNSGFNSGPGYTSSFNGGSGFGSGFGSGSGSSFGCGGSGGCSSGGGCGSSGCAGGSSGGGGCGGRPWYRCLGGWSRRRRHVTGTGFGPSGGRPVSCWVTAGPSSSTLTLARPGPADEGMYRCVGRTGDGTRTVAMEVELARYTGGGGRYRSALLKGEPDRVVGEDRVVAEDVKGEGGPQLTAEKGNE